MEFRHEWKHEINALDMLVLQQRLRVIAKPDTHAAGGKYMIRSLYFDTPGDRVLREKLDSINIREKFRIRYYNNDLSFIRLEKKSKRSGLGNKQSANLSAVEAQAIVDGDIGWMQHCDRPLVQELYRKMLAQGLRPKTVVDYTRRAFVFDPGNVRITLDYDIRTGLMCTDFLDPTLVTVPAGSSSAILEVKWDAFLPSIIRDAVQLSGRHTSAFSKYAACRIYG